MVKTVQHHNLLHDESLSAAVTTLIHPKVCNIFYRNLTRSGTYKSPTKEHQTNPRFYISIYFPVLFPLPSTSSCQPPFFIFFHPHKRHCAPLIRPALRQRSSKILYKAGMKDSCFRTIDPQILGKLP